MKKLLAPIALLLVLAAAGILVYIKQSKNIEVDSAAVEARGAAMWPGARPPTGLKGVLAISPEEGIDAVIFAPSLSKVKPNNLVGDDLRIVLAQPKVANPNIAEIKEKLIQARGRKDEEMETLQEKPTLLQVGGEPYPAMDSQVALKDGGKKLHENVTILMKGKQVTVVLIIGPEESFNTKLRDEFLRGLEVPVMENFQKPEIQRTPSLAAPPRPKRPRPGPPGLPGPPGSR